MYVCFHFGKLVLLYYRAYDNGFWLTAVAGEFYVNLTLSATVGNAKIFGDSRSCDFQTTWDKI